MRPAPCTVSRFAAETLRPRSSSDSCTDSPFAWRCQPTRPRAVIFEHRACSAACIAGSTVPGGSAKPRRNAAASIGAAARPLQRQRAAARPRRRRSSGAARAPCPARRRPSDRHRPRARLMRSPLADRRTRRRDRARAPAARAPRRPAPIEPLLLAASASSRRSTPSSGCGCGCSVSSRARARSTISRAPSARKLVAQAGRGRLRSDRHALAAAASGRYRAPSSICMMVMPVSRSPARIARWIGAAPRQRGSSEAWTLRQPKRGASRTACGRMQAVGRDHRDIEHRARRRPRMPPASQLHRIAHRRARAASARRLHRRGLQLWPRPAGRGGWL